MNAKKLVILVFALLIGAGSVLACHWEYRTRQRCEDNRVVKIYEKRWVGDDSNHNDWRQYDRKTTDKHCGEEPPDDEPPGENPPATTSNSGGGLPAYQQEPFQCGDLFLQPYHGMEGEEFGDNVVVSEVNQYGDTVWFCEPKQTAPPPPPAPRVTCTEPSVYQRVYSNGNTGIRLLTVGNLHPTEWELTEREFNSLDVSLTTDAKNFAFVQQEGTSWNLYVAETEDPDNRILVTSGMVSNPAINGEVEQVAFEVGDVIEVRSWDGELLSSVSDASQPFWFDQETFGFVRNGMIYRTSVNSVRVRALTQRDDIASEPVVSANGGIMAYTLNDRVVVMTNLESGETFTGAGDQPTLNADGSIMAYRGPNGQIFAYEDGQITQVTTLTSSVENPVLFCNRTIFFELEGEVNEVAYFAGMTPRRTTNVIATSGEPETQPSFSASTIRTREHQRPEDWTIATAVAYAEQFASAEVFSAFSLSSTMVV